MNSGALSAHYVRQGVWAETASSKENNSARPVRCRSSKTRGVIFVNSKTHEPCRMADTLSATSVPKPELSRYFTSLRSMTIWPPSEMSGFSEVLDLICAPDRESAVTTNHRHWVSLFVGIF
jgi:hypothetical protein